MENKNKLIIIAGIIIIIIAIVIISINKKNIPEVNPVNQSEIELNKAIEKDDINSINESLNNIKTEDTTDADIKIIDEEVEKL